MSFATKRIIGHVVKQLHPHPQGYLQWLVALLSLIVLRWRLADVEQPLQFPVTLKKV